MMRLGLDIGTNSIGWCLYELENDSPSKIIDGGARIFSDGRVAKTGASLAVDRRNARAARRRRDRFLRRRTTLMKKLSTTGLMPENPNEARLLEQLDPYYLRAFGLDNELALTHFGRALFHLNQRRGFKSNRKTEGNNEGGKIKSGTERLDQAMIISSARTYGEFLFKRREAAVDQRQIPSVRTRLTLRSTPDVAEAGMGYDFYPDRQHLEEEFEKLWNAQSRHHINLTDDLREVIFEIIFFQRPLKAQKVGRCLFVDEDRLPKAHPIAQQRVLYETVNSLRILGAGTGSRPLTLDERDKVITLLNGKKPSKSPKLTSISFKSLAKELKMSENESFSLDTSMRDALSCDPVRASLSHPDRFGPQWSTLSTEKQWSLISQLRQAEDRDVLIKWLMTEYHLSEQNAQNVADAPLPEGHGRLGETATKALLKELKEKVIPYSEAVSRLGWHHSSHRTGEVLDRLPYYGEVLDKHVIPGTQNPSDDDITRYGRITNPTVHIGLNQVRRLINKIITTYGKPDQVVVELARDLKNSEQQKQEIIKANSRNLKAAQQRSEKLLELGQKDTGANRMLLRIWEEMNPDPLKRFCPYTGKTISVSMIFNGECDEDHILPYSRTLDDSQSNKTLCLREANRAKGNKTPYEAWGNTDNWAVILDNLRHVPENKRWRFSPDSMEKFEGTRDFTERALVDTQYLSKISREYLDTLFTESGHVWVVPGRLTEMLRRHWGLNSLLSDHNRGAGKAKNRLDHRHHAVDAAVIAATDRGLIQRVSKISAQNKDNGLEVFSSSVPMPWESFRSDLAQTLGQMIVSHKADHGLTNLKEKQSGNDSTSGQLHNDTAYGLTGKTLNGLPLVVTRKPIDSLTPRMIEKINDPYLIKLLEQTTANKEDKEFKSAIDKFVSKSGPYRGIRHVRIIEPLDVIQIKNKAGEVYKAYKGDSNQRYEVWRLPDKKLTHRVVSTFEAHQMNQEKPHPAAKKIMVLHKGDMVKLDHSKFGPVVATVERFDANGGISLVAHNESNADQRYRKEKDDVYIRMNVASLIKNGGRRIIVDEIGHYRDPGPPT
jgi:CRISPR-associated endonuclease Csn1